jgi:hypothetical protein
VDRRRPLNGVQQLADAVRVGERLQHRAPRLCPAAPARIPRGPGTMMTVLLL